MAIKFVITEEEKPYHVSGTDFMASFSVTVSDAQQGRGGGGQPPRVITHEDIELLVAGVVADTQQTDDNGMALFQNVAISSPSRVVAVRARAEINGVVHTSAPKNVALPHPAKTAGKNPFDLELKSSGKDGDWTVYATIVAEDGIGIQGKIIVMRADGTTSSEDTEPDGTKKINLKITSRQETIRFLVAGTSIDKKLRLEGPRPKRPSFMPDKSSLPANLWEATQRAWNKWN
jgi:hypothetical protein